jgi:hypothetical protein
VLKFFDTFVYFWEKVDPDASFKLQRTLFIRDATPAAFHDMLDQRKDSIWTLADIRKSVHQINFRRMQNYCALHGSIIRIREDPYPADKTFMEPTNVTLAPGSYCKQKKPPVSIRPDDPCSIVPPPDLEVSTQFPPFNP